MDMETGLRPSGLTKAGSLYGAQEWEKTIGKGRQIKMYYRS